MEFFELFFIALGLSMDALAVSICKGLSTKQLRPSHTIICGAYFGGFQALMPLIGWALGVRFQGLIEQFDHWIAFVLLVFLGARMLIEHGEGAAQDSSFSPKSMLPLAIATSIDALAVGVTFAFLGANILSAVSLIGITTFLLSAVGVWVGSRFGNRFRAWPNRIGGIILIAMGCKILVEHLGLLG